MARRPHIRRSVPGAFGNDIRSRRRPPPKKPIAGSKGAKTTFSGSEHALLSKQLKLQGAKVGEFDVRAELRKPLKQIPWEVLEESANRIEARIAKLDADLHLAWLTGQTQEHKKLIIDLKRLLARINVEWERRFSK